jgi:lipopolysaccharide biosynthesis protein
MPTRDEAINGFLARWLAVGTSLRPATNGLFRRPCPGFHPQIYAWANRDACDTSLINPLAHFIRAGRPSGPWVHDVILPPADQRDSAPRRGLRCALHGHFFYPELAADLLRKLAANRTTCDLWLTTDAGWKAAVLDRATRDYGGGRVAIRLMPNRGRDIGPFLALAPEIANHYDLIGHVHGKRSVGVDDGALGETWREFLWQHLIGDCHSMLDVIAERFAADGRLGLVFPDDPYLSDWDDNRETASALAARMNIETLPPFFNFPIGTMFWARPAALEPLLALNLEWDGYPVEPLPGDGTILHAIERLLPFVVERAGYHYLTSHVPGVTR